MKPLTLEQANRIAEAALQKGRELYLAPLTVVVLDHGGCLKAMQREDGAGLLRPEIATAKAWGAVAMGMSSRGLAEIASERPAFMSALLGLGHGGIMPVPGGVLIRDRDGTVLGAVGISGDASDQDERCAIAGITAAELIADAGL